MVVATAWTGLACVMLTLPLVALADRAQLAGGTDPDALRLLAAASVAHLVMLGAATVLSVEKPGRRIRRGFRR